MSRPNSRFSGRTLKGAVEEFDTCATYPVAPLEGGGLVSIGQRGICLQPAQRGPSA
jgi:hypothetical protein